MAKRKVAKKLTPNIQALIADMGKPKLAALVGGALALLLLAFPLRFLVVPAVVNGKPIFSWTYVLALHRKAGQQILTQLINDALIEQEIAKNQIQVPQTEIDSQIAEIETNVGTESGGLEALLAFQGLTRDEFVRQLRLNLAIEKLVKSQITVTDEEVAKELATNPKTYQGLTEQDAATTAAENIRQNRLQDAFTTWFQDIRTKAKIYNFFAPAPKLD